MSVICEWGSVYVLAKKGEQLWQLSEKDTQSKLDILFKKNSYEIAIDLAQSSQYDKEGVIDIIRHYADHLYSKGDFDKAIVQYKKTIGYLEPSYIIRKFLDSQRIVNMTDYLQACNFGVYTGRQQNYFSKIIYSLCPWPIFRWIDLLIY